MASARSCARENRRRPHAGPNGTGGVGCTCMMHRRGQRGLCNVLRARPTDWGPELRLCGRSRCGAGAAPGPAPWLRAGGPVLQAPSGARAAASGAGRAGGRGRPNPSCAGAARRPEPMRRLAGEFELCRGVITYVHQRTARSIIVAPLNPLHSSIQQLIWPASQPAARRTAKPSSNSQARTRTRTQLEFELELASSDTPKRPKESQREPAGRLIHLVALPNDTRTARAAEIGPIDSRRASERVTQLAS